MPADNYLSQRMPDGQEEKMWEGVHCQDARERMARAEGVQPQWREGDSRTRWVDNEKESNERWVRGG